MMVLRWAAAGFSPSTAFRRLRGYRAGEKLAAICEDRLAREQKVGATAFAYSDDTKLISVVAHLRRTHGELARYILCTQKAHQRCASILVNGGPFHQAANCLANALIIGGG
jgi:hypothetical protein